MPIMWNPTDADIARLEKITLTPEDLIDHRKLANQFRKAFGIPQVTHYEEPKHAPPLPVQVHRLR